MSAAGTLPTDLPMTAAQPVAAAEEVFVRLLGASKKPSPEAVGGVTPQRRQCRRAIRCAFPLRQLTEPLDSRHSVSIHPYVRWVPSLGIVALHPPVTLHISPLGHGAGVQRHPRRCVYSSGAVPPRPDPIANVLVKGFRKEPD